MIAQGVVGSHAGSGAVVLEWNSQSDRLPAPPADDGTPQHWLPCPDCGRVHAVPLNVVAVCCPDGCPCDFCGKAPLEEYCEATGRGGNRLRLCPTCAERSDQLGLLD